MIRTIRYLACLPLLLLAAEALAEPLPIEYFVKNGDYLDVSLSPSGQHIAARARADNRVFMIVIDRASGEVVGGVRPTEGSAVHSVQWINDERLLFSYAEDRIDLDAPAATGELFAIDYDGKSQEMLAGFRASDERTGSRLKSKNSDKSSFFLVNELDGDDKHVLIVEYPWSAHGRVWYDDRQKLPIVSRMNVYTGRKSTVETLPFRNATPYSTKDGEIRFVRYQDEDAYFTAAYRDSDDAEWQSLSEVFELDQDVTVVGLNDAGTAVFLRGQHGDAGYYTIFRLDFETQTAEPLFTDLDADIADWLEDPETGEVVVGVSLRGKPRYHYAGTDSRIEALHGMLEKAFANRRIAIVSATDDGSELMVRVSSDTNPGEYYVFNTETNQASFFWANLSWIDPRLLRPMILDEITTPDGLTLPVRLTLPEGDGPFPLVVMPHGGPHGVADLWAFDSEVQLLANRGYGVLQANFRGSGYLGGRFQRAGYREWGGKMIDDIATATRWAMEQPQVDGSRICAYGASYGAYAAYMLAIREPELLQCTAGYVGVYDLGLMFTEGDMPKSWGGTAFLERVLGTDKERLDAFSPVKHADKIRAETLLIHGDADIRAPIEHAEAMRKALKRAGNEPGWIELSRSGHGAGSLENRLLLYEGLLAFLGDNLN